MPDLFGIDAGDFRRRRVDLQENTPVKNDLGQNVPAWTTIATVWAQILPASGQHFVATEQIRNLTTHKIVMRYYAGLTPRHRLNYAGRIFNILQVINEEEFNVRHTLLVQEVI